MLNPNLKLNTKLFDQDVKTAPTRAGFGTGLVGLGLTKMCIPRFYMNLMLLFRFVVF
jgi:hypothetical protein